MPGKKSVETERLYIYPHWVTCDFDKNPYPVKEMQSKGFWNEIKNLYICHCCYEPFSERLKYAIHVRSCKLVGGVVYSDTTSDGMDVIVYEIRGKDHPLVCAKLACVLGCMVPEKAVLYDMDHYNLYSVYQKINRKPHFVGAFSSRPIPAVWHETYSALSVFAVLPPYRRKGFGTFMIRLSRELSLSRMTTPPTAERPFSHIGGVSHGSVWRKDCLKAIRDLVNSGGEFSLADIAERGRVMEEDLLMVLCSMGFLKPGPRLVINEEAFEYLKSNEIFDPDLVMFNPVIGIEQKPVLRPGHILSELQDDNS